MASLCGNPKHVKKENFRDKWDDIKYTYTYSTCGNCTSPGSSHDHPTVKVTDVIGGGTMYCEGKEIKNLGRFTIHDEEKHVQYDSTELGYEVWKLILCHLIFSMSGYTYYGYKYIALCLLYTILITHKVFINCNIHLGRTLMLHSLAEYYLPPVEVIQLLLKCGANPNDQDIFQNSPLHYAVIFDLHWRALIMYTCDNDTCFNDIRDQYVKLLLQHKADVNACNRHGETPLHWATREYWTIPGYCGNNDIIEHLIQSSNINAQDSNGDTPLHWAAAANNIEAVRTLLKAGANTNVNNKQSQTPGDIANFFWLDHIAGLLGISRRANKKGKFTSLEWVVLPDITPVNVIISEICSFVKYLAEICGCLQEGACEFIPEMAGSMREGTKFRIPNEFDFNCWMILPEPVMQRLQMQSTVCVPIGCRSGFEFFEYFGTAIAKALKCDRLWKAYYNFTITSTSSKVNGPAHTISVIYSGPLYKALMIKIDLTASVRMNLTPSLGRSGSYLRELMFRYIVIASDNSYPMNQVFSFSETEAEILKCISQPARMGYTYAKAIFTYKGNYHRESSIPYFAEFDAITKQIVPCVCVSSYLIKNALFHALHDKGVISPVPYTVCTEYGDVTVNHFEMSPSPGRCFKTTVDEAHYWALKIFQKLNMRFKARCFPSFTQPHRELFKEYSCVECVKYSKAIESLLSTHSSVTRQAKSVRCAII